MEELSSIDYDTNADGSATDYDRDDAVTPVQDENPLTPSYHPNADEPEIITVNPTSTLASPLNLHLDEEDAPTEPNVQVQVPPPVTQDMPRIDDIKPETDAIPAGDEYPASPSVEAIVEPSSQHDDRGAVEINGGSQQQHDLPGDNEEYDDDELGDDIDEEEEEMYEEEQTLQEKLTEFVTKCRGLLDDSINLADDFSNTHWTKLFDSLIVSLGDFVTQHQRVSSILSLGLHEDPGQLFDAIFAPMPAARQQRVAKTEAISAITKFTADEEDGEMPPPIITSLSKLRVRHGSKQVKGENLDKVVQRIVLKKKRKKRGAKSERKGPSGPVKCPECDVTFSSESHLKQHEPVHKKPPPPEAYPCHICGALLKNKITLYQHMTSHSTEKNYVCETCGFTTHNQSNLWHHRKNHGAKTFPCEFEGCKGMFKTISHMRLHMRRVHDNVRPFVCETCAKRFSTPYRLRRHSMIHTGEQPHLCFVCGKGFCRSDNLKSHVERVHKLPFETPIGQVVFPSDNKLEPQIMSPSNCATPSLTNSVCPTPTLMRSDVVTPTQSVTPLPTTHHHHSESVTPSLPPGHQISPPQLQRHHLQGEETIQMAAHHSQQQQVLPSDPGIYYPATYFGQPPIFDQSAFLNWHHRLAK